MAVWSCCGVVLLHWTTRQVVESLGYPTRQCLERWLREDLGGRQRAARGSPCSRRSGHSAAMTLDRYSDLFDGDLNDIADAIDSNLKGI